MSGMLDPVAKAPSSQMWCLQVATAMMGVMFLGPVPLHFGSLDPFLLMGP